MSLVPVLTTHINQFWSDQFQTLLAAAREPQHLMPVATSLVSAMLRAAPEKRLFALYGEVQMCHQDCILPLADEVMYANVLEHLRQTMYVLDMRPFFNALGSMEFANNQTRRGHSRLPTWLTGAREKVHDVIIRKTSGVLIMPDARNSELVLQVITLAEKYSKQVIDLDGDPVAE